MARTRAKDHDTKRAEIMKVAARTFADAGYHGASMSALARDCGISKALVYHYYASKEALLFDIEQAVFGLWDEQCRMESREEQEGGGANNALDEMQEEIMNLELLNAEEQKEKKKNKNACPNVKRKKKVVLNEKPILCIDEWAQGLLSLLEKYLQLGNSVFDHNADSAEWEYNAQGHDARGKSQVLLVCFTLCVYLDRVGCREWPLMRQHSLGNQMWGALVRGETDMDEGAEQPPTGIPFHLFLERLFLTTRQQKKHLHSVELYLLERERYAAKFNFPPLLDGFIFVPKAPMQLRRRKIDQI